MTRRHTGPYSGCLSGMEVDEADTFPVAGRSLTVAEFDRLAEKTRLRREQERRRREWDEHMKREGK